jgi:transcriptional regulator with XRE-family HTH domain
MSTKDDFSERLRVAMAAAGLEVSGTVLERLFNRDWRGRSISVQTAWSWINGRTLPRQDKLQLLAKLLKVDPHALQYGAPEPLSAAERRRAWDDKVTYAERETLEAFLCLPTPQRLLVREVVLTFAKVFGKVEPADK